MSNPINAERRNLSMEEIDRSSLIHPFTPLKSYAQGQGPATRVVTGGQGAWIHDADGGRLLDAFAGLYCVNVGYGRTEIADAIAEQAHKLAYYHAYAGATNEPAVRLAEKMLAKAPGDMQRVYFGLSGSDANETQVKLVWYYNNVLGRPQKKKIIARRRGYHGGTIMSAALTGLDVYHAGFDLPFGPVRHTTAPHHYWEARDGEDEAAFSARCAAELEVLIAEEGADTIAAFIGEPALGTGGIVPPPAGYWAAIQAVLRKHDILLIADEVVCGFGRLGADFGCQVYDIEPDLITVAKGLTSAYLPLSGVMVGPKVWSVLQAGEDSYGAFSHGYTYSAHPLCAAAGLANLELIEREGIIDNVREVGPYLLAGLRDALGAHPHVGEIRGAGLLAAVEFVEDRAEKKRFEPARRIGAAVSAACAQNGLIARGMPGGDILGFAPPLVLTRNDADAIVERTVKSVTAVLGT
ncbi:aminotransferase [Caulobacter segnis]|uniref:aminotransferase n=1 Tax=Caulobacter segnis TaxID=88688 RepID=UPI00240F0B43|nr:aminotransferase [Caulobacter segnis]MDG2521218.1 aminotransferase [Caulobacter segnis]